MIVRYPMLPESTRAGEYPVDDLTDSKLARLEEVTQLVSMPMVSYQLLMTARRRPDGARVPEP